MSTFKREYPIGCEVFYHFEGDEEGTKLHGYVSFESLQEIMEGDEDFPDDDYLSGNNFTRRSKAFLRRLYSLTIRQPYLFWNYVPNVDV